jgi:hypothetical protein
MLRAVLDSPVLNSAGFLATVCGMEPTLFELTPEQKGLLASLSRETGKPVSALIAEALAALQEHVRHAPSHKGTNGGNEEQPAPPPKVGKPIWEQFIEVSLDIPDEELDRLPTDGASQHDHYIYGTPKRPV